MIDIAEIQAQSDKKKVYIETYGCQMNVYDSELVAGIMKNMEYEMTDRFEEADAIFLNTCAIRENAEQRVWGQLTRFKRLKDEKPDLVIGVLGCMAKHMEEEIHKKRPYVNLVLGPDSYRSLPELLRPKTEVAFVPTSAIGVLSQPVDEFSDFRMPELHIDTRLSRTEVYEHVAPMRLGGVTAWIAVMRGCDNFCTFCVVPFTRGRERSRTIQSVVEEATRAVDEGYSEVCLLGQNVNSYRDVHGDFADLMAAVSDVKGVRRIRFTSPHPKDFPERLLRLIAERQNICKHVHMPVQSGSNRILDLMNRTYTCGEYVDLIAKTRALVSDVAITTDVIVGFPSESESDHRATLDLFEKVGFDSAFTFAYSARPGTKAFLMPDDVPLDVKKSRLQEIIQLQRRITSDKLRSEVGKTQEVLVEGISRKSDMRLTSRTDKSHVVIIPRQSLKPGDYATVRIVRVDGYTLFGDPL